MRTSRIASTRAMPCQTSTSTCRSFATISSRLCHFVAILILRFPKHNGGPLHWGRINQVTADLLADDVLQAIAGDGLMVGDGGEYRNVELAQVEELITHSLRRFRGLEVNPPPSMSYATSPWQRPLCRILCGATIETPTATPASACTARRDRA